MRAERPRNTSTRTATRSRDLDHRAAVDHRLTRNHRRNAMDETLLALLDELARFGTANDAKETERPRRMLNITPATGRLLWILVRQARATRILEVGTSNAYSTI